MDSAIPDSICPCMITLNVQHEWWGVSDGGGAAAAAENPKGRRKKARWEGMGWVSTVQKRKGEGVGSAFERGRGEIKARREAKR